jgi:hypothetical protein
MMADREAQLGMIVIKCPNTGREIPTGLEVDRHAFQGVPVFFSRTYCPICRTNHEWFAKDARVRDEEGRAPSRRRLDAPRGSPTGGAGAQAS